MRWKVQSLAIAALATFGAAATAVAQTTPSSDGIPRLYDSSGVPLPNGERMWAVRPSVRERDFTSRFLNSGRSGSATLACTVQSDGSLTRCRAETESPRELGVGASAIRVARRGRLSGPIVPDDAGRQPIVRFTMNFPVN